MDVIDIIDSHIHLWPDETANVEGHAWMTPGHVLQKPHLLADYEAAIDRDPSAAAVRVKGAVYVETDVNYTRPIGRDLKEDLQGPLEEMKFLAATVGRQSKVPLLGLVPWAPLPISPDVFQSYLGLAEAAAGPLAWSRVKGVRYLVQAMTDREEFGKAVSDNEDFLLNLQELGKRGLSFEIAVDQNGSKGTWQLDEIATVMEKSHDRVRSADQVVYIVNHLCKPDFTSGCNGGAFESWKAAVRRLAGIDKTYMKLSGAFSELPDGFLAESPPEDIVTKCVEKILPWFEVVISSFGPSRTMFGSDWPVCTVGFPGSWQTGAWPAWKAIVGGLAARCSLKDQDLRQLYSETARVAYRL